MAAENLVGGAYLKQVQPCCMEVGSKLKKACDLLLDFTAITDCDKEVMYKSGRSDLAHCHKSGCFLHRSYDSISFCHHEGNANFIDTPPILIVIYSIKEVQYSGFYFPDGHFHGNPKPLFLFEVSVSLPGSMAASVIWLQ